MSATLASEPALDVTEVLARTLWGEAAERPVRAIEAMAALILNRARAAAHPHGPAHWGSGIAGVCRAPFQFPCWNPNHPRHDSLRRIPPGDGALAVCRRVASRAASGVLPDPTGGATHAHDSACLPAWAIGRAPLCEISGLVFYRLES